MYINPRPIYYNWYVFSTADLTLNVDLDLSNVNRDINTDTEHLCRISLKSNLYRLSEKSQRASLANEPTNQRTNTRMISDHNVSWPTLLSISAPSYKESLLSIDSVCLSVRLSQNFKLLLLLVLDGIEPFFRRQFYITPSTRCHSSIFDLLPWQQNLSYFLSNFKLILLFCFSMESSHICPLVLHDPLYKTLFFDV